VKCDANCKIKQCLCTMEYHSILLDIFYVQVRSDMKLIFIEEFYAVRHVVIIET